MRRWTFRPRQTIDNNWQWHIMDKNLPWNEDYERWKVKTKHLKLHWKLKINTLQVNFNKYRPHLKVEQIRWRSWGSWKAIELARGSGAIRFWLMRFLMQVLHIWINRNWYFKNIFQQSLNYIWKTWWKPYIAIINLNKATALMLRMR